LDLQTNMTQDFFSSALWFYPLGLGMVTSTGAGMQN